MSSTMIMLIVIAATLCLGITIAICMIRHVEKSILWTMKTYITECKQNYFELERNIYSIDANLETITDELKKNTQVSNDLLKAIDILTNVTRNNTSRFDNVIDAMVMLTNITKDNTVKLKDLRDCMGTIDDTVVNTIRDSYSLLDEMKDELTYIYTKEAANDN